MSQDMTTTTENQSLVIYSAANAPRVSLEEAIQQMAIAIATPEKDPAFNNAMAVIGEDADALLHRFGNTRQNRPTAIRMAYRKGMMRASGSVKIEDKEGFARVQDADLAYLFGMSGDAVPLKLAPKLGMLRIYAGDATPARELAENLEEARQNEIRRLSVAKATSFAVKTDDGAIIIVSVSGDIEVFDNPVDVYCMYWALSKKTYLNDVNESELPQEVQDALNNLPQFENVSVNENFMAMEKSRESIESLYQDIRADVLSERNAIQNAVTIQVGGSCYYDANGQLLTEIGLNGRYEEVITFTHRGQEICKDPKSGFFGAVKITYRDVIWTLSQWFVKRVGYRQIEHPDAVQDLLFEAAQGKKAVRVSSQHDSRFDVFKKGFDVARYIGYGVLFLIAAAIF